MATEFRKFQSRWKAGLKAEGFRTGTYLGVTYVWPLLSSSSSSSKSTRCRLSLRFVVDWTGEASEGALLGVMNVVDATGGGDDDSALLVLLLGDVMAATGLCC